MWPTDYEHPLPSLKVRHRNEIETQPLFHMRVRACHIEYVQCTWVVYLIGWPYGGLSALALFFPLRRPNICCMLTLCATRHHTHVPNRRNKQTNVRNEDKNWMNELWNCCINEDKPNPRLCHRYSRIIVIQIQTVEPFYSSHFRLRWIGWIEQKQKNRRKKKTKQFSYSLPHYIQLIPRVPWLMDRFCQTLGRSF